MFQRSVADMSHEISDFQVDVIERSATIPVLVDFWAEWCGPCRVLGPILERLSEKQGGRWVLAKVNTDAHQDIAARYGVRGIPNVKLFVDGKVLNEFTGALPERAVEQWLETALPDPFRRELEMAREMIRKENVAGAQVLLEGLLQRAPANEQARVLLAGTYVFGNHAKAEDLVKGIEEHSPHFPSADAIRTIVRLRHKGVAPDKLPDDPVRTLYLAAIRDLSLNNFDTALEKFINVIRLNRMYDDDGARKAVVAIFKILGNEHPIVLAHRRSFSSALYT
jgi:putative thioredoxin